MMILLATTVNSNPFEDNYYLNDEVDPIWYGEKRRGFIGYGGGFSWNFETIQDDNDIETDITVINETVLELEVYAKYDLQGGYKWDMALCNISGVDYLKYMEEDSQGGFEYSYPEELDYIKLEYEGLPSSWCEETNNYGFVLFSSGSKQQLPSYFRLIFPEGEKSFKMFTGSGTEVKIGSGGTAARIESYNTKIVKDTQGKLHLLWADAASDIQYANSTDNGTSWTTKEIHTGASNFYNIMVNSTDGLWVIWTQTSEEDIYYTTSGDSGGTWTTAAIVPGFDGNLTHQFDDVSAIMDSNDNVHLCVITAEWDDGTSNDFLIYSNYTASTGVWSEEIWVNENAADDTDYCDIAVDSNGVAYIVGSGGDDDSVDIWISTEGWGDENRKEIHQSSSDTKPAIHITEDDQIYFTWEQDSSDLGFANSTPTNAKAGAFTTTTVDSSASNYPNIKVTEDGDIFIMYVDTTTSNRDVLYANSTDDGVTWDIRNVLVDAAWTNVPYGSMRGSLIGSDIITDRIDFLYWNDTDNSYYFDYFTVAYTEAAPEDTTAPAYSGNSSNTSTPSNNEWININVTWTDDNPALAWFGNNFTGAWINDTPRTYTSARDIGNATYITAGASKTICWQAWANDTGSYINETLVSCIDTQAADTCSCPSPAANWYVDCSDDCDITEDCDIEGYGLYINGAGTFTINANINVDDFAYEVGTCKVNNKPNDGKILSIKS